MRSDRDIRTNLKINGFLQDILGENRPTSVVEGEFSFVLNQMLLQISVHPWRDKDTLVRVQSTLNDLEQVSPSLGRRLLEVNHQIARIGAFGLDNRGRLGVQTWLLGSSLDKETLRLTIQSVSLLAQRAGRLMGVEPSGCESDPLGQDIFGYQFEL